MEIERGKSKELRTRAGDAPESQRKLRVPSEAWSSGLLGPRGRGACHGRPPPKSKAPAGAHGARALEFARHGGQRVRAGDGDGSRDDDDKDDHARGVGRGRAGCAFRQELAPASTQENAQGRTRRLFNTGIDQECAEALNEQAGCELAIAVMNSSRTGSGRAGQGVEGRREDQIAEEKTGQYVEGAWVDIDPKGKEREDEQEQVQEQEQRREDQSQKPQKEHSDEPGCLTPMPADRHEHPYSPTPPLPPEVVHDPSQSCTGDELDAKELEGEVEGEDEGEGEGEVEGEERGEEAEEEEDCFISGTSRVSDPIAQVRRVKSSLRVPCFTLPG